MNLSTLIENLPISPHAGPTDVAVASVVEDSRRVQPGSLFVARAGGETDGRRFAGDAAARGAAAVLSDRPLELPEGVAMLLCDDVARTALDVADRFYGNPSDRLTMIGVTGTNGKTTTAYMVRHLLNRSGRRCGMIGTVEIDDGRTSRPARLTTPGGVELLGLLGAMAENGCDSCVMEVSSHALHQGRAAGLDFDAAVFTNLSGDHLDYHGTMEEYAAAKAMLFESLRSEAWAIVNVDDPASGRIVRDCAGRVLTFGFDQANEADCHAEVRSATARHTDFQLTGPWGEADLRLPLIGRHNVANMLAALGVAYAVGLDMERIAVDCPPVPGRLETVRVGVESGGSGDEGPPFEVLVDYAHTDDALANVLWALRPVTEGRLRVLFGCGGDRDLTKRPRMAAVACRLADDIIITSDNPRTEDPAAIVEQVLAGVPDDDRHRVRIVLDRAEAIGGIITDAKPGDVVLIAGKGHEDYQIIGTERRPFDDRLIARAALEALRGSAARS